MLTNTLLDKEMMGLVRTGGAWMLLMLALAGMSPGVVAMAATDTSDRAPQTHTSPNYSLGYTLDACFDAALQKSETIADQTEQVAQAEENYKQAKGSMLPTVNGVASYLQQQPYSPGTTSSFSPSTQRVVKITADQPLFRGFRDFAGLRQIGALSQAQKQAKRQAVVQLYETLVQNFFTVLAAEKDLQNFDSETGLYEKRIKELHARVRIGRSRPTEVLTVESSLAAVRSQIEQIQGQINAGRENLAFLTGLPLNTALIDNNAVPSSAEALDDYLNHVDDRPDVKAARIRYDASKENVNIAKGAHLPSVDLTGNYYLKRNGILNDVKWDVGITLTVPIYAGGILQSKVRNAYSQERQGELALSLAQRQATNEIRTFYSGLESDIALIKVLTVAAEVARKSYTQTDHDYSLGLVTNLDVLQALTSYQESRRALDHAQFNAKIDFQKLQAATGARPQY